MRILSVFGTRPEYLKIKPILEKKELNIKSCFIKQHTNILSFPDADYSIEIKNISDYRLNDIFAEVFSKASEIFNLFDAILIQGDTATVAASSLCAFNLKKKIIYLESGLRSFDFDNPFPEEGYRQIVSRIANIHFCPTDLSLKNLEREKISGDKFVTGNTCLDNLLSFKNKCKYSNKVLITMHRNENLNLIRWWLSEIEEFAEKNPDIEFIMPTHPNPIVKKACEKLKYIKTCDPLSHIDLINLLKDCKFVITDSGGIQEEATFLNKKTIVCRKTTERPEGIKTGHITLCTSPKFILKNLEKISKNHIINQNCPYGDGTASSKIISILKSYV